MKRHLVWIGVILTIVFLGFPNMSMAGKVGVVTGQIAAGTVAIMGGCLVGVQAAESDIPNILGLSLVVGAPLLASSGTVYAIGRGAGYRGKYWATLSGGILPTAGILYYVYHSNGNGGDTPNRMDRAIWGTILFTILVPVAETIAFHLSDSKDSNNQQTETRFIMPLLQVAF